MHRTHRHTLLVASLVVTARYLTPIPPPALVTPPTHLTFSDSCSEQVFARRTPPLMARFATERITRNLFLPLPFKNLLLLLALSEIAMC